MDGKVTISTALNNEGFEQDAGRLQSKVAKFGAALANAFTQAGNKGNKALATTQQKLRETDIAIKNTQKQMSDIAKAAENSGDITSKAFENAKAKVKQTEIAIAAVEKQMQGLKEAAASPDAYSLDKGYQQAQAKIKEISAEAEKLMEKAAKIESSTWSGYKDYGKYQGGEEYAKSMYNYELGTNEEYQEIIAQLEKLKAAHIAQGEVAEKVKQQVIAAGGTESKEYQKLQGELDKLKMKREQQIIAEDTAKEAAIQSAGAQSSEYKRLESQLERLKTSKEQLQNREEELAKTQEKTTKTTRAQTKENNRYSSSTKKAASGTGGLLNAMVKLGTMLKLMVIRQALRATVQAVKDGFKDLAQVSTPFNAAMSQMQTKSLQLRNAFTSAVAPAVMALAPIFNTVTNAIIRCLNAIAAFTAAIFGNSGTFYQAQEAATDYAGGVAGAGKAAKKAAGELAAFDELNVLNKQEQDTGGGGGGGGAPAPGDMWQEVTIPKKVLDFVEKLKKLLEPTAKAMERLWEQLKVVGDFAWDALEDFYNGFLVPVGEWTLGEGLPRFIDAITNGLAAVDWQGINDSLMGLWEALAPFAITIGEGLIWLWENVLVPLGVWVISDVLPAFLDLLAAGLIALNEVIDIAKPLLLWLWEDILQPLGQWVGGIVIDVIRGLADELRGFAEWASENQGVVEAMISLVLGFLAGVWAYKTTYKIVQFINGSLIPAFVSFGDKLAAMNVPLLVSIFAFAVLAGGIIYLASQWDKLTPGERAITILGALAAAAIAAAIAIALFHTAWSVGIAAAAIAAGIALLVGTYLFTKDDVGAAASVGGANGGGGKPFSMPTNASAFAGNNFDASPLPHLATGAVIPANKEFVAVLGDQTNGRNLEAPEGLIRQIMQEELARMGFDVNITFNGDLAALARILKPEIDKEGTRVGGKMINGGAF